MSFGAKREYLKEIWGRYQKSTRNQKSLILDEFCEVTGLHFGCFIPGRSVANTRKDGRRKFCSTPKNGTESIETSSRALEKKWKSKIQHGRQRPTCYPSSRGISQQSLFKRNLNDFALPR